MLQFDLAYHNEARIRGNLQRLYGVEHAPCDTLKNQGYHLEHNYGMVNSTCLSTVFAQLMMLAFLVDQVQESSCRLFQTVRRAAARDRFHARIVLWERLRSLFIDFDRAANRIPDWATLWAALIRGHDQVTLIPAAADTS